MKISVVVAFIFIIFLSQACDSPEQKSSEIIAQSSFDLEIVDSLDIPILGMPMLSDVSADGTKITLYDWPGSEVIIADSNGDILHRWKKNKDTPDSYGFMMSLPGFVANDQVAIVGMRGFFIYDLAGNLVKKLDHAENMGGAAFMGRPGNTVKYVERDNQPNLLYKSLRGRDTYPGEDAFYEKFRAAEFLDINTGEYFEMGKFEENSRFLDGMGYIESDYMPAFEYFEGNFFMALGNEPILRKYRVTQDSVELVASKELELPELIIVEGEPRSSFDPNSVTIQGGTGSIRQIFQIDEYLAVSYFSGIPEEEELLLDEIWEKDGEAAFEEAYEKVLEKVPQGIFIINPETLEILGEIPFPKGVNQEGFVVKSDAFWFEKVRSEEEEEEFIRIYKMKLIEK